MLNVHTREGNSKPVKGVILWMHGLGANANDMMHVAEELRIDHTSVRHVFLDAPVRPVTINQGMRMQAWYDIFDFGESRREDEVGIQASFAAINEVIEAELKQGLASQKLFLAGFSQGAAMALYTALHSSRPLGGVIALSGYLPLAATCQAILDKNTPFFIGYGEQDPIVLPAWSQLTHDWLRLKAYSNLFVRTYAMEHSICQQEIMDLSNWLTSLMNNRVS